MATLKTDRSLVVGAFDLSDFDELSPGEFQSFGLSSPDPDETGPENTLPVWERDRMPIARQNRRTYRWSSK